MMFQILMSLAVVLVGRLQVLYATTSDEISLGLCLNKFPADMDELNLLLGVDLNSTTNSTLNDSLVDELHLSLYDSAIFNVQSLASLNESVYLCMEHCCNETTKCQFFIYDSFKLTCRTFSCKKNCNKNDNATVNDLNIQINALVDASLKKRQKRHLFRRQISNVTLISSLTANSTTADNQTISATTERVPVVSYLINGTFSNSTNLTLPLNGSNLEINLLNQTLSAQNESNMTTPTSTQANIFISNSSDINNTTLPVQSTRRGHMFNLEEFRNYQMNKDLRLIDSILIFIGLGIGVLFCLGSMIITVGTCAKVHRHRSYDNLEFLGMKTYHE